MKLAILFCVIAFVCAAQASPTDLSRFDGVQGRSFMIEAAKEKLQLAKNKFDSLIQKALDILEEKLNDAKQLAKDLMEKLKAGAVKAADKIYSPVQEILNKVSRLEGFVKDEAKNAANYEAEAVQCPKIQ